MDVCVSLVALPRWNATLAWWRLEAAGERMERITDTEDRGRERGEYTVHSLNTGDQHQLVTCAYILIYTEPLSTQVLLHITGAQQM